MLSLRSYKTSRTKLAVFVAVGVILSSLYYLLIYTNGLKTKRRKLEAQKNATESYSFHATTPKSQSDDNHERLRYIGEHPICTRKQIRTQVLPSCAARRASPAKQDIKVQMQLRPYDTLEVHHGKDLASGGLHHPKQCKPREKVAIIVPYRDRPNHLKIFLNHIHPFLKKQKLEYMIIVVEQKPGSRLNRGMLRNIGFVEAEKICSFDCIIFNDIDLMPLRENNYYTCGENPRHHAVALKRFNYKLPYDDLFGGVVSLKKAQFIKINGYSNMYFDWGGEDDDLGRRVKRQNMTIGRYPITVSRYAELTHDTSKINKYRYQYLEGCEERADTDGLNSLKYQTYLVEFRKLYTWIYVGINETEVLSQAPQIHKQKRLT